MTHAERLQQTLEVRKERNTRTLLRASSVAATTQHARYRVAINMQDLECCFHSTCKITRLKEHNASLKTEASSNLALHCRSCGCSPVFTDTRIVYKHWQQINREVAESYHIVKEKDNCVSQASVDLCAKQFDFLRQLFP